MSSRQAVVTPAEVIKLTRPTDGFLCPLSANTYGIEFLNFVISDYDSKKTIFEVGRDNPAPQDMSLDFSYGGEDMYRKIRYDFSEDVLRLPLIQTSLQFAVGDNEVHDFRMIERHYFQNKLVKSFDFEFGFCIPSSVNTWDAVYSLPALSESLIEDMIEKPFETQSDSFYFVEDKLIMHNKAAYRYLREDGAQAKKSYEDKFSHKGSKASKLAKDGAKGAKEETYLDDDEPADAKPGAKATRRSAKGTKAEWSKESDYY
mmetsp:Transcript_4179/g.4281  ORF Transcript_4179/g.4281 Transcript_4179/m.4281 type:complete len:259 (-) Transcript_4179:288-1064(-)|eukprot:CAMPEP_0182426624 /NCGR_PEP_ID=MMETSP1167-20130531/13144_1 /TAXON_ID=2988 /ORGANISM="Mallomonas Sp, Strain CCMP3275" /LENGTH=258 /DNA_ID=CAMNT_0024608209 /DNA_START=95 /DNA_END=871 /DNA_ORIENTATION=-